MDFASSCRCSLWRDFAVTALTKKILQLAFSNLQDIFITIKSCLGIFLASFRKKKIAAMGVFPTFYKEFSWPSRVKGIIGRDLKFAAYVPHYKIWTGNIFGLILKNKMAAMGVSLSVMKSAYISLIICPRGLVCEANLWDIMGWESSDVFRFDLGPLLQGQTRIHKLKSAYSWLIIGPRGLQCETNL